MTKKISRQIPMDDLEIYTYPVIVFPYFFDNSALLVFGFSLTRKEKNKTKQNHSSSYSYQTFLFISDHLVEVT